VKVVRIHVQKARLSEKPKRSSKFISHAQTIHFSTFWGIYARQRK